MKLSQLAGQQRVTDKEIQQTDEYREVVKNASEEVALLTCRIVLRGTTGALPEAASIVKAQLTAFGALRRLADDDRTMTWVPSGPGGNNAFVSLVNGDVDKFDFAPGTTVNCWEVVLLAAVLDGQVTTTDSLRAIYSSRPRDFEAELIHRLTGDALTAYDPSSSAGKPLPGDIVLFGGLDHVVMATGKAIQGPMVDPEHPTGTSVISFWPAPLVKSFGPNTRTKVDCTTIEAILEWYSANHQPLPTVTFGSPRWSQLNQ
ncbi:hypothetical protein [Umezawaea sp. Da 62-37]|uniref:hypothetical protein n=1 Tax=Umezawaea sp. Da 62-37 TaxID=3075927 RepID=UPI0028F71E16|nr:hypothetical protein [Umezawaea sp. Da 62-37]WNV87864.1 hypothetical protein RM788_06155 [Umezawaea sp. Da 62-37]